MTSVCDHSEARGRRRFMKYPAASPLLAAGAGPALAELIMRTDDLPADQMWLNVAEGLIARRRRP